LPVSASTLSTQSLSEVRGPTLDNAMTSCWNGDRHAGLRGKEITMDHYGAHILATTRRTEFAADASASRRAAAARERSVDQLPSFVAGRTIRARRPATA
jgi:hypothetical protein